MVNFGFSRREYDDLTKKEKAFIVKEWETKLVRDVTFARDAHLNAIVNGTPRKSRRFIELFKKKPKKTDAEELRNTYEGILAYEKQKGTSWVDRIKGKKKR